MVGFAVPGGAGDKDGTTRCRSKMSLDFLKFRAKSLYERRQAFFVQKFIVSALPKNSKLHRFAKDFTVKEQL